jgi:hypothetical protein
MWRWEWKNLAMASGDINVTSSQAGTMFAVCHCSSRSFISAESMHVSSHSPHGWVHFWDCKPLLGTMPDARNSPFLYLVEWMTLEKGWMGIKTSLEKETSVGLKTTTKKEFNSGDISAHQAVTTVYCLGCISSTLDLQPWHLSMGQAWLQCSGPGPQWLTLRC